ncbi:hypothetical protein [Aestuariivirga sp.]|uniref:hypothetical protein n=1 Tax=Aestuariivirga sp. TaxID=2650926 RepID=UPI003593CEB5
MNWEGHDDWMLHAFPEFTLEALVPGARPLPSPACPVTEEQAENNPYEQIPLPHHGCPPRPEKAEPPRQRSRSLPPLTLRFHAPIRQGRAPGRSEGTLTS